MGVRENRFEVEVLVNNRQVLKEQYPDYVVDQAPVEDILLYIVKNDIKKM